MIQTPQGHGKCGAAGRASFEIEVTHRRQVVYVMWVNSQMTVDEVLLHLERDRVARVANVMLYCGPRLLHANHLLWDALELKTNLRGGEYIGPPFRLADPTRTMKVNTQYPEPTPQRRARSQCSMHACSNKFIRSHIDTMRTTFRPKNPKRTKSAPGVHCLRTAKEVYVSTVGPGDSRRMKTIPATIEQPHQWWYTGMWDNNIGSQSDEMGTANAESCPLEYIK